MIAAELARQSELDQVVDQATPSAALADDLFAVVGLLEQHSQLRNALADPTASVAARQALVATIVEKRVGKAAAKIVAAAAASWWESGLALVAALERQGERVLIEASRREKGLDRVEDELFRFERTVAANDDLRVAIENRNVDLARREALVADLLEGKVDPVTRQLAVRAVAVRGRTYALTVQAMLALAAQARQRAIAQVTVARPLSAKQAKRLGTALAAQVGSAVSLEIVVDPAVLGGVRVRVGDELIDGTVLGRLDAATRQLN